MDALILIAFILGFFSGALGVVIFTIIVGRHALKKHLKKVDTQEAKVESVGSRMKKVKDMTSEQLDLQGQASLPQKNALHGRYKNGVIGRIKELEGQKNDILKSIIADGFDPEITVIDETGVVTTIKLSEFLAQSGVSIPTPPPASKEPTVPPSPKQVGRFMVHKGGKDDGSGNTTH